MTPAILIPYRGTNDARVRNLEAVLRWYAPLGWPVTLGDSDQSNPRFNRAASRNAAAEGAGDWDVALIADADCCGDIEVIKTAALLAQETGKLIIPHDDFYRFSERGTKDFIDRMDWYRERPKKAAALGGPKIARSWMPSGALVVTRESFDRIGRYDPGFKGWGYEDSTFLKDAARTVGYHRLAGTLYHLYHPRDTGTIAERAADREYSQQRAK